MLITQTTLFPYRWSFYGFRIYIILVFFDKIMLDMKTITYIFLPELYLLDIPTREYRPLPAYFLRAIKPSWPFVSSAIEMRI